MLNQALNEIQAALDTLNTTVHSEQTEVELSGNLEMVKANISKTIAILQNLEHTLGSDKLKVISHAADAAKSPHHYYPNEDWQKTA